MSKEIFKLEAHSLGKRFGRNRLFSDLSVHLKTGDSLAITGPNGSGKSTLLQILAGINDPDRGAVTYFRNGEPIIKDDLFGHIGFSSPYLNPYDELTGYENLEFAGEKSGSSVNGLLDSVNLSEHGKKLVKYYSSGMKQRLKFLMAVMNEPDILFLDEPGTNLDSEGKRVIYSRIEEAKKDRIILIATNERSEVSLCSKELALA